MVEGGMKCIKYLIFAFNFIFAITGIALISLGGVVQVKYREYVDFLGDQFFSAPVLLIIVGVVIFIVGFFGCCGAIKENHCMTITFGVLLAIIFILELAAGISAYVLRNDLGDLLNKNMNKAMGNYNEPKHQGVTKAWDGLQHELDCCGTKGYKDWSGTTFGADGNVPDSCCRSDTPGCGQNIGNETEANANRTIHTNGCLKALEKQIVDNIAIIGGVGVGIAFIQVLGIILACCLATSIRKEYETV